MTLKRNMHTTAGRRPDDKTRSVIPTREEWSTISVVTTVYSNGETNQATSNGWNTGGEMSGGTTIKSSGVPGALRRPGVLCGGRRRVGRGRAVVQRVRVRRGRNGRGQEGRLRAWARGRAEAGDGASVGAVLVPGYAAGAVRGDPVLATTAGAPRHAASRPSPRAARRHVINSHGTMGTVAKQKDYASTMKELAHWIKQDGIYTELVSLDAGIKASGDAPLSSGQIRVRSSLPSSSKAMRLSNVAYPCVSVVNSSQRCIDGIMHIWSGRLHCGETTADSGSARTSWSEAVRRPNVWPSSWGWWWWLEGEKR
ncbi:hypothetical protein GGX14DRAFT_391874 [Mycena pura]|uniref:Uncharacterized protein n=1 Tax=Mycena pura TaxID=153505 RepID=A0AAD6VL49_9AGAR|nr:hypothetical protein GGX14DRAFT_391874 [Mycena pura]